MTARSPFPRKRLAGFDYTNPDVVYFVTVCARSGTAPFTDPDLATEVISALTWLRTHRTVTLYAFCLMPDHLHLPPQLGSGDWSLGDIMRTFKTYTTKRSWALGYTGQLWQDRFYDHILRKSEDAWSIAIYILENPVRQGLVVEAEAYPYSGMPDPME